MSCYIIIVLNPDQMKIFGYRYAPPPVYFCTSTSNVLGGETKSKNVSARFLIKALHLSVRYREKLAMGKKPIGLRFSAAMLI